MVELTGVAHFAIPVSDPERSARFYTEIVGCKFLHALPDKSMTFLDAGGVCVLLIKRPPPIVRELEGSYGVHHAFMLTPDDYRAAVHKRGENGRRIFLDKDRQGGVLARRCDSSGNQKGTALEFINRTAYVGN